MATKNAWRVNPVLAGCTPEEGKQRERDTKWCKKHPKKKALYMVGRTGFCGDCRDDAIAAAKSST